MEKVKENIDKQESVMSVEPENPFSDEPIKEELGDYEFCKALYSLVQLLEEVDLDDE